MSILVTMIDLENPEGAMDPSSRQVEASTRDCPSFRHLQQKDVLISIFGIVSVELSQNSI